MNFTFFCGLKHRYFLSLSFNINQSQLQSINIFSILKISFNLIFQSFHSSKISTIFFFPSTNNIFLFLKINCQLIYNQNKFSNLI
jgi:hypothetical protein